VHPQILKPTLNVRDTEVALPIGAQTLCGAAGAYYERGKSIPRSFNPTIVG
jgi:hypothetical protein